MRVVVADTGPLNYLVLIGHVSVLPVLFETVFVPEAVRAELDHPETPPPVRAWIAAPPGTARLRLGLAAIYGWFARNADLAACVLRDAEVHELTRETVEIRLAPAMRRCHEVLGEGLGPRQRAMLHLMLGFPAWRSLVRESGLAQADAIETAVRAIEQAG